MTDIKLNVTCAKGITGVSLAQEIQLSPALVLQKPSTWPVWNRLGPRNGTVELTSGNVDFRGNVIEEEREKGTITYVLQMTMSVPLTDDLPPETDLCFGDTNTGEKVVGTWIAEGGG
jgi:hypothetical protein